MESIRRAAPKPRNVFLNIPFDSEPDSFYLILRYALLFAVSDCGFVPRGALEKSDSGEVRFHKILHIIAECPLAIHDISCTRPDKATGLPRFNMPFEVGVFIGAGIFGETPRQSLILDSEKYRHQKFFSDIAGNDILSHEGGAEGAIIAVRDWLNDRSETRIFGGDEIAARFNLFMGDFPAMCRARKIRPSRVTYRDYFYLLNLWLAEKSERRG